MTYAKWVREEWWGATSAGRGRPSGSTERWANGDATGFRSRLRGGPRLQTEFFTPQQLVLDIALCGDWAGVQSIYSSTCPGTCNVTGPGSPAYDNAWFEINYVRAFTTGGPAPTSTTSSSAPTGSGSTATTIATVTSTAGSGSPTGSGSGSSQNDTNAAVRGGVTGVHAVGAVLLSVIAGIMLAAC
ncbi:hypothetical protein NUW54_g11365 [Trametes sanguinea]|uniref:Uncharacterized protein n=1 Tax=Trametes sanguinea TaxID=158606 RepID=A0ACC1NG49_9APHY|nr:hypothetical protein NUW54_g11365 [Trametes sanguinea]